jgi:hypothetical protein
MAELSICIFSKICDKAEQDLCSHARPHYMSHTREANCKRVNSVCCSFKLTTLIQENPDEITYEYKGELRKVNPTTLRYPRCISYSYWKRYIDLGADIVCKEFSFDILKGNGVDNLRDGYRSYDFYSNRSISNMFKFLISTENRREPAPLNLDRARRYPLRARIINAPVEARGNGIFDE